MTTNTSPTQGAAPPFDLTPRPGQADAEIAAWMGWKFPNGLTNKSSRAYYGALVKGRPRDKTSDEYREWMNGLTETQRGIAEDAHRQKDADPKVQAARKKQRAARKAELAADKIRRAADPNYQPEYQAELEEKRAAYAATQGREIRPYRRDGKVLTEAERKAEKKRATDKVNAGIRDDLASGRNPFSIARYDRIDYAALQRTSWAKMLGTAVRQYLCDRLIANGEFNMADADLVQGVRAFCAKVEWCSDQPDDERARDLIGRAVNSLRAAGAISKKGDVVSLHRDIERQRELDEVKNNPNWGAF